MKKFLLLGFCLILFVAFATGQNLSMTSHTGPVLNGDTTYASGDTAYFNIISDTIYCKNSSATGLTVKVRKKPLSVVPGTSNYFCWDQCYSPSVMTSTGSKYLQSSDAPDAHFLTCDYRPMGHLGATWVQYTFFDVANPNDSICVVVKFNDNVSDVAESALKQSGYIYTYPNPADDHVSIAFSVTSPQAGEYHLIIRDITGRMVYETRVKEKSGVQNISVKNFNSGLYFYSLAVGEKTLATKKLIIQH